MRKQWEVMTPDPRSVRALERALGCHPVTAAVLVNRRIHSPEQAGLFLEASLAHLRPPTGLKDVDRAARRIARAVCRRESILLFGDYDVDGTTGTAVLLEFLKACGANVGYAIPHRLTDGYGLKPQHIPPASGPGGASLVITVDCGSGSHAAVDAAAARGVDVIITDHHHISAALPAAAAVVNPKRPDCPAGLGALAGVGVAFYLAIAVRRELREAGFFGGRAEPNLKALCDLVALGTVADMVPLREENRILARAGLEQINGGGRPGLRALAEVCGIAQRPVDADDIAFRLAPRLNAAGRVGHAALAVELLTADGLEPARRAAQDLNALNLSRRALERGICADIDRTLARCPQLLERRTLVLAETGWHEGVLGVAASRMVEKTFRPVVLIGLKDGRGRGSARSVPGLDIYASLEECRDCLLDLGGHAQAAGLQIEAERVPEFREAFEAAVVRRFGNRTPVPLLAIDARLALDAVDAGLADQLEALAPFGNGNPEPLFMAEGVAAVSSAPAGADHRRMVLAHPGSASRAGLKAIQFNRPHRPGERLVFERVAFRLRWNRWNGSRQLQLIVEETWP
jgi:single-stranded-DNA-specific exonuclease